jgi:hypothetical protein
VVFSAEEGRDSGKLWKRPQGYGNEVADGI